jgi:hypothetical protein
MANPQPPYADNQFSVETTLRVDFRPNTEDPARVFRAMSSLIDAFTELDRDLARSAGVGITPVVLLADISTGSLKARLRTMIEAADDEAIRSLDWKRVVGGYLLRGKHRVLEWLRDKPEIESTEQVRDLQQDLLRLAQETNASQLPAYEPIPASKLLRDVARIGDGMHNLRPDESAALSTSLGEVQISREVNLTAERIEDLLTRETITGDSVLALVVKKPDYLGTSMWECRHEDRHLDVKILDLAWLARFHARKVDVRPGDALRARVRSEIKYGHDGAIVAQRYFVVEVLEVIQALSTAQDDLFEDGAA